MQAVHEKEVCSDLFGLLNPILLGKQCMVPIPLLVTNLFGVAMGTLKNCVGM